MDALSARQREVLELLAKGLSNEQIGLALGISPTTVRTHVTAVLAALQVGNRTEAAAVYVAWCAQPAQVAQVLERPAIAVLPLRALSVEDEARARRLAAGLTCDLASLFARWCWFPVISGGLGEAERLPAEGSRAAGQRLGARFVVDGALRTSGARWRLTVRVDDSRDGVCLWTERYEGAADGLLTVEDELCEAIVAAAYPVLVARAGARGSAPRGPGALAPWELAHEGMALQGRRDAQGNAAAQERFAAALAREPELVLAHYGLGLASYDEILNQWGPAEPALDRLVDCAERCVALAPHAAEGYYLFGRRFQTRGEHALAASALEAAIGRNPSFGAAHALLAQTLVLTGRADEGLTRMKQAVRLGPRSYVAGLAVVHFVRGEYAEALAAAETALSQRRAYPFGLVIAAASAFWLGRAAVAAGHMRALRRVSPGFLPSAFRIFGAEVEGVDRVVHALEAISRRG